MNIFLSSKLRQYPRLWFSYIWTFIVFSFRNFLLTNSLETSVILYWLPRGHCGKESACQCRRWGLDFPGQEDPLAEEMAIHCSILAWEISWTEEPGGLTVQGIAKSQTQLSKWAHTSLFTNQSASIVQFRVSVLAPGCSLFLALLSLFPSPSPGPWSAQDLHPRSISMPFSVLCCLSLHRAHSFLPPQLQMASPPVQSTLRKFLKLPLFTEWSRNMPSSEMSQRKIF